MSEYDRVALIQRFKYLTERTLPARAAASGWTLRLDHCFKRVCLDQAFGDVWYNHLARPAERHLEGDALLRAVQCAEELATGDAALLEARNRASLHWRGKLRQSAGRREASERL